MKDKMDREMKGKDNHSERETLYRPIMEVLREEPGLHVRNQIPDMVADRLGLTESQRNERSCPRCNDDRTKHQKNTAFALTALRRYGMADSDGRGHWSLTQQGCMFLSSGRRADAGNMGRFMRDLSSGKKETHC